MLDLQVNEINLGLVESTLSGKYSMSCGQDVLAEAFASSGIFQDVVSVITAKSGMFAKSKSLFSIASSWILLDQTNHEQVPPETISTECFIIS